MATPKVGQDLQFSQRVSGSTTAGQRSAHDSFGFSKTFWLLCAISASYFVSNMFLLFMN